ncbi:hypothetical protein SRHO_G00053270 [Serrasalmus rhombeus]
MIKGGGGAGGRLKESTEAPSFIHLRSSTKLDAAVSSRTASASALPPSASPQNLLPQRQHPQPPTTVTPDNHEDHYVSEGPPNQVNALCRDAGTITDVCNSTDLPEVEIISLLEEQLPHYQLRADTIYGYDHDDWLHTPLISPDTNLDLTTEQIEETLKYFQTWLNHTMPDSAFQLAGRQLFRADRNRLSGKARGGGLCVYINKGESSNKIFFAFVHSGQMTALDVACKEHCLASVSELRLLCSPSVLLPAPFGSEDKK